MSVYLDKSVDYSKIIMIGDRVRSWDFPPREGVEDRYIEGRIAKYEYQTGLFIIEVEYDNVDWGDNKNRVGSHTYFPAHLSLDWHNRVEKI